VAFVVYSRKKQQEENLLLNQPDFRLHL